MNKLRIIGDIHGKFSKHLDLIEGCDYSIQLGDLGFNYKYLKDIDFEKHKFIHGNHDNIDDCQNWPHFLGRFGELNNSTFFVSGGFSIDQEERQKISMIRKYGKTYWLNEELSIKELETELETALEQYKECKPDIMLSHEAPRSIIKNFTDGKILKDFGFDPETFTTRTSEYLQLMFEAHRPKLWVFGHYHRTWTSNLEGTKFVLLPEFGYLDLEVKL